MRTVLMLIICLIIPLTVGFVSGISTIDAINGWYAEINKPVFNPPNWLFGPVWTTLYFMMGISLYLIWKSKPSPERRKALQLFTIQLLLNFLWSPLFFAWHQMGLALIEIILMWLFILLTTRAAWKLSRPASVLLWPYLAWVSFASVLNGALVYLN